MIAVTEAATGRRSSEAEQVVGDTGGQTPLIEAMSVECTVSEEPPEEDIYINQSLKQDRDRDEVYLKTSPSQSSAHGVRQDSGSVCLCQCC